jgi:ATP-dependent DNA helicase RecG
LKSVQLYQKDYSTGQEGFTLAAILLFGRDDVIASVLPFHKTDAICRIINKDRYDDRDDIRTNLIESYDRLMRFVENHIPEKFVLKDDIRINVRNLIFREVIANTLIHREYTNPYPAKLIIESGLVQTENANKAHGMEQLTPQRFTPFPKNPVIARVFKEIGRADELGSGARNIFEYYKYYSDNKPSLEENDVFNCVVYTDKIEESQIAVDKVTDKVADEVTDKVTDNQRLIIQFILENNKISASEMAEKIGISKRKVVENIKKLKEKDVIQRVGSPKAGLWIIKN